MGSLLFFWRERDRQKEAYTIQKLEKQSTQAEEETAVAMATPVLFFAAYGMQQITMKR